MFEFFFKYPSPVFTKGRFVLLSTWPAWLLPVREAASRLEAVEEWRTEELTRVLEQFAEDLGLSKTKAWQPIRAAVTGSTISPPLPESIALLGREKTLERLRRSAETNSDEYP